MLRDRSFHNHSHRNASSGSTFAACRIGIQRAKSPAPTNNALTTISVAGSLGCISNRKDLSTRDKTIASATPTSTPAAISRNPSPKINLRMSFVARPPHCESLALGVARLLTTKARRKFPPASTRFPLPKIRSAGASRNVRDASDSSRICSRHRASITNSSYRVRIQTRWRGTCDAAYNKGEDPNEGKTP